MAFDRLVFRTHCAQSRANSRSQACCASVDRRGARSHPPQSAFETHCSPHKHNIWLPGSFTIGIQPCLLASELARRRIALVEFISRILQHRSNSCECPQQHEHSECCHGSKSWRLSLEYIKCILCECRSNRRYRCGWTWRPRRAEDLYTCRCPHPRALGKTF